MGQPLVTTRSTALALWLSAGAIASARADDAPAAREPDVRALVAQALQEQSPTDQPAPRTAGHDSKGSFIADQEGNFRLSLRSQIQFRWMASLRDEGDVDLNGSEEDDFEAGFQTRRTKLIAEGHAFDPSLTFKLQGAVSRINGDMILEDAFWAYAWDNGWAITVGQFKLPFWREELIGSTSQLAVEQSIVSEAFNSDYSQGVQGSWTGESVRAFLAFSDGLQARNSDFSSPRRYTPQGLPLATLLGESDYAVTGRVEFKHGDGWSRFRDYTSEEEAPIALLLGASAHVEGGERRRDAAASYIVASWAADAQLEGDGWTLSLAGVGSHTDLNARDGLRDSLDDFGVVSHAGVRIPGTAFEPFLQYAVLLPDPDRTGGGGVRAFNALTIGFNYYLYGHAAKFTADMVWRPDDQSVLFGPRTSGGHLGDDDPHELTLRLQWQLLF